MLPIMKAGKINNYFRTISPVELSFKMIAGTFSGDCKCFRQI